MKLLQLLELAAEIFEQLPKANLAYCHLMLKFAKWQMIDDECWKIHDTTNQTNVLIYQLHGTVIVKVGQHFHLIEWRGS